MSGCEGDPQAKTARHMQNGLAYVAESKYKEAIIEFRNASQLTPRDAQVHYQLGLVHLKVGLEHIQSGNQKGGASDLQQALRAFNTSVKLDANNLNAQLKLGELYLLGKNYTETQTKAEAVLQHAPDNVEAHVLLGNMYASKEEWGKAIERSTATHIGPQAYCADPSAGGTLSTHNNPDALRKRPERPRSRA